MKKLLLILFFVFVFAPANASAKNAFKIGPSPAWFLLGGLDTGVAFGSTGTSGYLGGELSLNRLKQTFWTGLFLNGSYDFGQDNFNLYAGPQFGLAFFGIDGGIALRKDTVDDLGPHARVLFSVGAFSLYGRHTYFKYSEDHVTQVGMMLKLPFWATE